MKYIIKDNEPQEFIIWKEQNQEEISRRMREGVDTDAVWNLLPSRSPNPETEVNSLNNYTKENLRRALLHEQGYLCCYCNRPLNNDHTTKIEHFRPKDRDRYPALVFTYENLLASCDGGERDKDKPRETYCDTKKGNSDPTSPIRIIHPLQEDCQTWFDFDEMGKISPAEGNTQAIEAIRMLGLDARALNVLREKYINEYIMEIWAEEMNTDEEIVSLQRKVNDKFFPFCTAIISILRNYP